MIELEKTYLMKSIPKGLKGCKHKEVADMYIPKSSVHPIIRIRKDGSRHEITKKAPIKDGDASKMYEYTIDLSEKEYSELMKLDGKKVRKIRYYYDYKGRTAEIDVFQDALKGLIVVDFEFKDEKEKEEFKMPDFCLADITQQQFTAGGMLCGKEYEDIKDDLNKFGYKKMLLE